jgi:membrane-bound lytic murein transglycosylase MltF
VLQPEGRRAVYNPAVMRCPMGILTLALLLAALQADAQTASPPAASPATMQAALLKPFKGDWEEIKQRRMLRALVVYSQTLYYVDRGQQRGVSYEILKAFEDQINAQLKTRAFRFQVFFIPVSRDELIPALLDGRGDIAAANLTITPEREKLVDFSIPVRENVTEVVVTGPSGPRLASLDDLAGQTVHTRRSSSYWEHLEALNQRLTQAGKAPVKLVPVSEDLEDEDLLEMANAGLLPIVVCDAFILDFWKSTYTKLSAEPEVVLTSGQDVAWMMRKDSPQLKAVVDAFVKTHRKGTSFGNQLFRKYQKPRSVRAATAKREMEKFQATVDLFRKYGGKYDLDYLLVMAQGYQESRLDQGVKSPVGALGVMQLMPATGEQMKVGDIKQIEPNIHAGVKYLRFVEDNYFDEPTLAPVVKALFAFASYNAGPNRIQTLRKEAAKRGLDPNRWFKNVEYVVGEKIGQETVTYVSNIFKYYVAYQLVAQAEEERRSAVEQMQSGHP